MQDLWRAKQQQGGRQAGQPPSYITSFAIYKHIRDYADHLGAMFADWAITMDNFYCEAYAIPLA